MNARATCPSSPDGAGARGEPGWESVPRHVANHGASAVLEIGWLDGSCSLLGHGMLRANCRCAACVALRRTGKRVAEAAAAIRLDRIEPVGQQGLNLVFSDGHARGIFPWAYLRELGAVQP